MGKESEFEKRMFTIFNPSRSLSVWDPLGQEDISSEAHILPSQITRLSNDFLCKYGAIRSIKCSKTPRLKVAAISTIFPTPPYSFLPFSGALLARRKLSHHLDHVENSQRHPIKQSSNL
jgi:hypothetical protein